METIKVQYMSDIPESFTGIVEYRNRDREWYKNGGLHREDGPAVEYLNGHKEWWFEGQRHRTDGPAVECINEDKEWWIDYVEYYEGVLQEYIETCIVLDVEECDGGTYWIKILCEDEIIKYPFIPGMAVDISSIVK